MKRLEESFPKKGTGTFMKRVNNIKKRPVDLTLKVGLLLYLQDLGRWKY